MSQPIRRLCRRRAIAFSAIGIGSWGRAAHALDTVLLKVGDTTIEVSFVPGDLDLSHSALLDWIRAAASAATVYYGRFPVSRAIIQVSPAQAKAGVMNAVTYGGPARTTITVGQHTSAAQLKDDWTMTHELVHMAFPSVRRRHHWIEEGLATYVEPVARAQAGFLRPEKIWLDMVRDMPQGEPGPADGGLDGTHSWGRTYWGGALFCLLADVKFRERTENRRGLQHALRGILAAGGTIDAEWPLDRALRVADDAVGVPVLTELYTQMKDTPVAIDLTDLWRRLGISVVGRNVTLRANAPLAAIRLAITATFTSNNR
jgi:hypothetical protein